MSDSTIPLVGAADGVLLTILAILAHETGMAPSSAWGRGRLALLILGLVLILGSLILAFRPRSNPGFIDKILKSSSLKQIVLLGHIWGLVALVYIWFITFGNWTTWTHTTSYYDKLANSFSEGHLFIDIKPDPALLASSDPYAPGIRPPIQNDIFDMSFYKGKFYLYWGPVPALLLLPIKAYSGGKITDNYLDFFFYLGLLVFSSLVLLKLWRWLFSDVPAWAVYICIPLLGLMAPVLWPINEPNIYDAAVGGAQFFFMGGIYWILLAFEKENTHSNVFLFLAGIFWAAAVGTRAMYAATIIPPCILVVLWILSSSGGLGIDRKKLFGIFSLALPLVLGAITLAWYNWARFGSPLEFGLRYQISIWDLNKLDGLLFLPSYIPSNLIVYLLQPFQFIPTFPFIEPIMASDLFHFLNFTPPAIYYTGRLTGLAFSAPFVLLALSYFIQDRQPVRVDPIGAQSFRARRFVHALFLSSFLVGFLLLLLFFVGSMRYLMDVISPLSLLAIMMFWRGLSSGFESRPLVRKAFSAMSILLILLSIAIGFLLAFSQETNRFQVLNPGLFNQISHFFLFK